MNEFNIEIAISTLNDGVFNSSFCNDYNYILIHQVSNDTDYSQYTKTLPENVRYILSRDVGLSKSRNLAIENAKSDYLWIMDDDVKIHERARWCIQALIEQYPEYAMFVVSHSHEDIDFLPGRKIQNINRISAANVSSIDMILNCSLLDDVVFNDKFGLGTKYPSGEEYIFACNLLSRRKKILKSRSVCSYHPLISSGKDFYSTSNKLKAKLEMFKAGNGHYLGAILYFAFLLKKSRILIKNKALLNAMKAYL